MEQVQARQRAHLERNAANQLTKEQRAEKQARKLFEDTSKNVTVALFYVKNMSHPYHRTKVDLNAQQNSITGGVLECKSPSLACVICEGGPKAIKRFTRLMLVRMKWPGPDDDEGDDEDDDDKNDSPQFDPNNKCLLVWTGMSVKRLFKGFVFQACETSETARKILAHKNVEHYWDHVLASASGQGDAVNFRLGDSADGTDSMEGLEAEDDVEMKDATI
mmetsp:Transcript_30242/g.69740  ORF Transcript_30242/g.69740 Transcript_30242/m.69740 type:complete len:219 (-) Transcript_30242:654-1310(-)